MPFWLIWWIPVLSLSGTGVPRETVVVTGSYEPVPLEETDRAVRAIPVDTSLPLTAAAADLLRLDPSIDVEARAPGGVQADVSIRGGGYAQTLVMLNGLRLNDAQSGHHNMDIPVPLEALSRIEVLKGAGSAFYGSDAVGGAVNLITRAPEEAELRLTAGVGNFGMNRQSGVAAATWRAVSEQLSFSRDFSSGFAPDRDYRSLAMASVTHAATWLGATDLVMAESDRPFGADQFYGNFNSWERTRSWFAAARQDLGRDTEASFAYRRHTDLFVLYRDRPEFYTNRHAVESYETALRRHQALAPAVEVSYGGEYYRDAIQSSNLGNHERNRGAGYAALEVRALRRFSFSAGGREEFYGAGQREFSPTVSAGFWASSHFKLRASASHAFRLPSYTELYYHDPANVGSPDLRPERAWSYEAGLDWNPGRRLHGEVTVFDRRERDGIDYVRRSPDDIWRAANFNRLAFAGVEASIAARVRRTGTLEVRYSALRASEGAAAGLYTKYSFNYPVHNAVIAWTGMMPGGIVAETRLGVVDRRARDAYALWDGGLAYTRGRLRPFFRLGNITSTSYQEVLGVPMPGREIAGGVQMIVAGR